MDKIGCTVKKIQDNFHFFPIPPKFVDIAMQALVVSIAMKALVISIETFSK